MKRLISVVVPAYNEESTLLPFHDALAAVLAEQPDYDFEIIFVNDGSTDGTQRLIDTLCAQDPRVGMIDFSRNFGKEIAMTAGLDHAKGDAVVIIDADLQDPPSLIHQFIVEWNKGFDVVYAQRTHRDGESLVKRATAKFFYRILGHVADIDIPADAGDYRLLSRRAVTALMQLRERHRFMKGLFAWVGFPSKAVLYRRNPRVAGETKFSYWYLWNLALEGITSFSIAPLKIATYFGFFSALLAFLVGTWIIFKTLYWEDRVPGYPTLMVSILFLGGIQLFFIGVLGEYLGRIYDEIKRRPLYLIKNRCEPAAGARSPEHEREV